MAAVNESVSNTQRTSVVPGAPVRGSQGGTRPTFAQDQLSRRAAATAPISYDATLDGRPVQAWMKELGGKSHHASFFTHQITDAELRAQVADLCNHAAHVKDEKDLAALGHQAQDLLDRVNATPAGKLSEAARASAARAVVPLAQAGEFNDLLAQAQTMLADGSPAERRQASNFMLTEGPAIRTQFEHLDVPQAAIDVLEAQWNRCYELALYVHEMMKDEEKQEAKFQAARNAWAAWWQRQADKNAQLKFDSDRADTRLQDGKAPRS